MVAFAMGRPIRRACLDNTSKRYLRFGVVGPYCFSKSKETREDAMAWTTPVLIEICIGLEINGYLPADGYVPPEF